MKKMMSIIMVLMLTISVTSLALADEAENGSSNEEVENEETQDYENETEDPVDNETIEEIEIMNYSLGSEIRLLQLEKAITRNILKGEMTVDILKGLDYNTSDLELIIAEMRLILEEVNSTDPESNDSVEIFVGLKSDAKNLTTQFRDTIKDLLSDSKYNQVREQIRENASELQNYSKKIRNRIKHFNRNQMYKLYGIVGQGNNSLVNQYMNGTMSINQVKLQLGKMISMNAKQKQKEIFSQLRKEKIHTKANANSIANKVTNNFLQSKQGRLQERLKKINNTSNEKLKEFIQNKINNNQNIPNVPGNETSENNQNTTNEPWNNNPGVGQGNSN